MNEYSILGLIVLVVVVIVFICYIIFNLNFNNFTEEEIKDFDKQYKETECYYKNRFKFFNKYEFAIQIGCENKKDLK